MESHLFCLIFIHFALLRGTPSCNCSSNKKCNFIRIDETFFKADCSRKGLSDIPIFNETVIDIDLSGNENLTRICAISSLPQHLVRLDISSCNLRSIELGAFEKLNNLTYLDISWNTELTMDVLPNVTNDLIGSNINTLKFNAIQCSVGGGTTLKYEHLCRLQNSSLLELELSKNRIDMIERFTLYSLPSSLTNISAGHNRLRFGLYFLEFISLKNLRFLNLSDTYAMDNPFEHPWRITCDDDRRNNINSVGTLNGLLPCPTLNRQTNAHFPNGKVIMHLPPKLETLVMNNCIIRVTKKWENFVLKYESLKRVYASNNFLQDLKGFDHSLSLEEADFSNSFIREIDDLFFNTSNLTTLDLSYNLLGDHFSKKSSAQQLRTQKFLKFLSLSHNRLQHAHIDLFKGLIRLEMLNISETELKKIHFTFEDLTYLRTLDMSNNRIRTFTDSNMHEFDYLSERSSLSINLTGNDISCTCETLKFLTWMQRKQIKDSRIILTNFENYTCSFANSSQKSLTDISDIILELEKTCSSKSIIYIISGCGIFLFIIVAISGILYRYRWKLRYIYHMTRRNLRGYFSLQDQDGNEKKCFEFDVFISYAEEDAEFAYEALKSKVQNKYPSAKLCYHLEQFYLEVV